MEKKQERELQNIFQVKELNLKNLCLKVIADFFVDKNMFKKLNFNFETLPQVLIVDIENALFKYYGNIVWKVAAGDISAKSIRNTFRIFCLAISPNDRFLVSSNEYPTALMWDLENGNLLHVFAKHINRVTSLAISADSKFVITGSADKSAMVWQVNSGKMICLFEGHNAPIESIAASSDNEFAASCSTDGKIKAWDIHSGICFFDSADLNINNIKALAISSNNKLLISISEYSVINFWDIESETNLKTIDKKNSSITCTFISHDSSLIAAGNFNGMLIIWNLKSSLFNKIKAHSESITAVAISMNNLFFVTGSSDFTAKVWDANNLYCIYILQGHKMSISAVSISKSNKFIVTGSIDKSIKIWKINSNLQKFIEKMHAFKETKIKNSKTNNHCLVQ